MSKTDKQEFHLEALYHMNVYMTVTAKSLRGAKQKVTRALNEGRSLDSVADEFNWDREGMISYEFTDKEV